MTVHRPKKRSELASECSNYHNDEVSCNLASDNGTPCIYKVWWS